MQTADNQLSRLIYASRIKQTLMAAPEKIDAITQDVLKSAHAHNPSVGITGVLFYGEGCFFQCLEGPKTHVDDLYKRICSDPRHEDITVLLVSYIDRKYFAEWSMKLVQDDQAVKAHLSEIGLKFFNPYLFDTMVTNSLIKLFTNIN